VRKRAKGERIRERKNGETSWRKCRKEEQKEGTKHRGKQFRRQLSVSRAKIADQFPPLRACANLFLLFFIIRSASPATISAVAVVQ